MQPPTTLITFLGTGNYQTATYTHPTDPTQTHTTPYIQHALCHWLRPHTLQIYLTQQAQEKHLHTLQKELHQLPHPPHTIQPILIPEGKNPQEFDQILQTLIHHIPQNHPIHIDITHSFRHIPLLILTATQYLQTANPTLQIQSLYYAQKTNQDQQDTHYTTLDLTPYLHLQHWLTAAHSFTHHGNPTPIAQLLETTRRTHRQNASTLHTLQKELTQLSLALQLPNPPHIQQHAQTLLKKLQDPETQTQLNQHALPLQAIQPTLHKLLRIQSIQSPLHIQHNLIHWYFHNNMPMQALALAREHLIDLALHHLQKHPIKDREQFETQTLRQHINPNQTPPITPHPQIPTLLLETINTITEARNNTLHCGKNTQPLPPKTIHQLLKNKILPTLQQLLPPTQE